MKEVITTSLLKTMIVDPGTKIKDRGPGIHDQ